MPLFLLVPAAGRMTALRPGSAHDVPDEKEPLALKQIVWVQTLAWRRAHRQKSRLISCEPAVSVRTPGDHVWDQKDLVRFIRDEPRLLRPR